MPHMLSLNNAAPLGLEQQISITHICHLFFSQEEVNKHANGQTTFNLTKSDFSNTTQGYRAVAPDAWECYCSLYTVCIAAFECVCVTPCVHVQYVALCAHICLHTSLGIHWWIHLLSPIILCFADGNVQSLSMPLCFFFSPLSPQYRQTGKQTIIL